MKLAVVGTGRVASSAVQVLEQEGVRHLHLSQGSPVFVDPAWFATWFPNITIHRHPSVDVEWMSALDLCLLAVDSVDVRFVNLVNSVCLAAGVTLLPGLMMGDIAQVGPRIRAGGGPCLQCLEVRVQAVLGRPALVGPYQPVPSLAAALGREIALRAANEAEGPNVVEYLWADGRRSAHHLLRVPGCPACRAYAPPAWTQPTEIDLFGGPPRNDARIVETEPLLVDELMGVVRSLASYESGDGEPRVSHAVASIADPGWAQYGQSITAGGSDIDPDAARAAALGEALDRVATIGGVPERMVVAPFSEVAEMAIDPLRFDLYELHARSRSDFPFVEINHDTPLSWMWGWSMALEGAVLVPATRVLVPMTPITPGDAHDRPNVTGCATGSSPAHAALSGLLEVVERDAFTIAWLNRLPLVGIDLDGSVADGVDRYRDAFADAGIAVRAATVRLDWGIPLVVAIARSRHRGDPAAVVSAAADLDVATAVRRALKELTANLAFVRSLVAQGRSVPPVDPAAVRDQDAHALLYAQPEAFQYLEHWWAPPTTIPMPDTESLATDDALRAAAAGVIECGGDVVVVDLGMSELAERGIFTYKVVVPEAYPMDFDSLWPHLGGERLTKAPFQLGLVDAVRTVEQLNPIPHPFP